MQISQPPVILSDSNSRLIEDRGEQGIKVSKPSSRIKSLDGLRAISIILVLMSHSLNRTNDLRLYFPEILKPFSKGGIGVSIFFAISGFLITTLLLNETRTSKTLTLKNFYVRRLLRIAPSFYAYLLVLLILRHADLLRFPPTSIGWAAAYLTNYNVTSWPVAHSWSLSVEEQFYLTWPLIVVWGGKRLATKIALYAVILAPLSRLLTFAWGSGTVRLRIWEMTHTRIDTIMLGCLVALLWEYRSKVPKQLLNLCAAFSPVFLFFISPALFKRFGNLYFFSVGLSIEALCCAVILVYAVLNADGFMGKFLNSRVMVHIGVLSYSLYIWQTLFLDSRNIWKLATLPWSIVLIFVVAECSYALIERPANRLKSKFA